MSNKSLKRKRKGLAHTQKNHLRSNREADKENDPGYASGNGDSTRSTASQPSRPIKPLPKSAQASAIIKKLTNQKYEKNRSIKNYKLQVAELQTKVADLEAENTSLKTVNATLASRLASASKSFQDLEEELRINKEKCSGVTYRLACAEQELFSLRRNTVEKVQAIQIEADRVIDQYAEELEKRRGRNAVLHREITRLKRRIARGPMQLQRAIIADRRQQAKQKKTSLRSKGIYTRVARSVAIILERSGCAQSRIGASLKEISRLLGVPLDFKMSRRTVRRCVIEAGVAASLQVGHMLSKAVCTCDSDNIFTSIYAI